MNKYKVGDKVFWVNGGLNSSDKLVIIPIILKEENIKSGRVVYCDDEIYISIEEKRLFDNIDSTITKVTNFLKGLPNE
tara:strand:- start:1837 stop:2070 length:234 start_codon:yes stop_codon:yes gene_type:complete